MFRTKNRSSIPVDNLLQLQEKKRDLVQMAASKSCQTHRNSQASSHLGSKGCCLDTMGQRFRESDRSERRSLQCSSLPHHLALRSLLHYKLIHEWGLRCTA